MALQKANLRKRKGNLLFKKKLKRMLIILRKYGKLFLALRNEIRHKVNQSKIALKNDGAFQFEPTKNTNIFKDFHCDLAG